LHVHTAHNPSEPARWALTRGPCDLGRRHAPILDEVDLKPIITVQTI
jgi:hypothetical protein